jgi:hypothetical protein
MNIKFIWKNVNISRIRWIRNVSLLCISCVSEKENFASQLSSENEEIFPHRERNTAELDTQFFFLVNKQLWTKSYSACLSLSLSRLLAQNHFFPPRLSQRSQSSLTQYLVSTAALFRHHNIACTQTVIFYLNERPLQFRLRVFVSVHITRFIA